MNDDVVCWKCLIFSDVMEIKSGGKWLFKSRYKWKCEVSLALPLCEVVWELIVKLCDEK
jgi:hypothetical protein